MKLSKLWMAGVLTIVVVAVAMVAVACGSAEPEPAQPAMSAADITDAVRSAVSESQMSEADLAGMMSDQIAEQVAAMAAANPGLSAEEVNAMIMGAVADSSAMLADQLEMMGEEGMSEEEMAAMMQQAIGQAVDEAVMMAMPEEAEEEMMMEPGMSGPKHGGTLSVATTGFLSFDVDQIGVGAGGEFFYFHRAFEGLIERGPEDELVNRLVQSWEANAALSVYTIKVQPGVKFHDGEDLTSEDIKYTIDRMLTPESASPVKATLKYIESIEAPDSHTVIFNLNGSNAEFPRDLADYHLRVLPAHVDYSQITDGSVGGSGSFVKVSHNACREDGVRTQLELLGRRQAVPRPVGDLLHAGGHDEDRGAEGRRHRRRNNRGPFPGPVVQRPPGHWHKGDADGDGQQLHDGQSRARDVRASSRRG